MSLKRLQEILHEIGTLAVNGNSNDPAMVKIDCGFAHVALLRDKTLHYRDEILALVQTLSTIQEEASYIQVGREIGDQAAGAKLFGVGHFLKFWEVTTPASFGVALGRAAEFARKGELRITRLRIRFS
jgi:hypothetical protein